MDEIYNFDLLSIDFIFIKFNNFKCIIGIQKKKFIYYTGREIIEWKIN